jgi:hypothetical protein
MVFLCLTAILRDLVHFGTRNGQICRTFSRLSQGVTGEGVGGPDSAEVAEEVPACQ